MAPPRGVGWPHGSSSFFFPFYLHRFLGGAGATGSVKQNTERQQTGGQEPERNLSEWAPLYRASQGLRNTRVSLKAASCFKKK